ncbi:hypothetical protein TNCV_3211111 [Trichonephila clavipes]|uniref:Uncharacterized protein n=1 Tax=Trichonephila clavipes TaxID=2585209 RepID=A0A8X6VD26_TRICX|nr:hypothetical protein TNCV_3211111 [Trichonephila clavipes]
MAAPAALRTAPATPKTAASTALLRTTAPATNRQPREPTPACATKMTSGDENASPAPPTCETRRGKRPPLRRPPATPKPNTGSRAGEQTARPRERNVLAGAWKQAPAAVQQTETVIRDQLFDLSPARICNIMPPQRAVSIKVTKQNKWSWQID